MFLQYHYAYHNKPHLYQITNVHELQGNTNEWLHVPTFMDINVILLDNSITCSSKF